MKTETIVIQILESVIGAKNVRRESRFLDIGGNSLNLVQVLHQIREKTGVDPGPRMFFDKQLSTVVAISAAIDSLRKERAAAPSAAE